MARHRQPMLIAQRPSISGRMVVFWAGLVLVGFVLGWGTLGARHSYPPTPQPRSEGRWDKGSLSVLSPEYDRRCSKVIVSVSSRDTSLIEQDAILCRLPDYAQILLLGPEMTLQGMSRELAGKPYAARITPIPYTPPQVQNSDLLVLFPEGEKLMRLGGEEARDQPPRVGTIWTQDLFEVASGYGDKPVLFIPDVHKYYYELKCEDGGDCVRAMRDNMYLGQLSEHGFSVQELPVAFKGGNILPDVRDGISVVFCGEDVIYRTMTLWGAISDAGLSRKEAVALIRAKLNVDRLIIPRPEHRQPQLLYHLDQAMLLLPNGVVGVERIVYENDAEKNAASVEIREVEAFLTALRVQLAELNYKLFDIEVTVANVESLQHYANAIPYVDARTRKRVILMSCFPDRRTDRDIRVLHSNTRKLEELGYAVVPVPTETHKLLGGIHCLVNIVE